MNHDDRKSARLDALSEISNMLSKLADSANKEALKTGTVYDNEFARIVTEEAERVADAVGEAGAAFAISLMGDLDMLPVGFKTKEDAH